MTVTMPEPAFYYVIEHATGVVRAAQSTLAGAMNYTTPQNCHERFIVGPMTATELYRTWNTLVPQQTLHEDRS